MKKDLGSKQVNESINWRLGVNVKFTKIKKIWNKIFRNFKT